MDGTTREFDLDGVGLKLVLAKGADDLTQRDVDAFFEAYRKYPQGNTVTEDNGKTVRAAFDAKWILEFMTPKRALSFAADVNETHPSYVRWAAQQIDAVIARAREIPLPLSSRPPTMPIG